MGLISSGNETWILWKRRRGFWWWGLLLRGDGSCFRSLRVVAGFGRKRGTPSRFVRTCWSCPRCLSTWSHFGDEVCRSRLGESFAGSGGPFWDWFHWNRCSVLVWFSGSGVPGPWAFRYRGSSHWGYRFRPWVLLFRFRDASCYRGGCYFLRSSSWVILWQVWVPYRENPCGYRCPWSCWGTGLQTGSCGSWILRGDGAFPGPEAGCHA